MANTYTSILKYGTQAAYVALETKDANVLYFTDKGKIYKGTQDFTESIVVVATAPAAPVSGKIYYVTETGTLQAWVNSAWQVLSRPEVTTIDATSDDNHLPTAKSVYDFVTGAIADVEASPDTVKSVAAKAGTDATITVTKKDGSTSDVTLGGVVTTPTWDATLRKLTLPVSGKESVEVNIGKDMFLDPAANNHYDVEKRQIVLYLNDGDKGSSKAPTELHIPVGDLVDEYTGNETASVNVTVGADNKISAAVKLAVNDKNALSIVDDAEGVKGGLFLDLSAYAKNADITGLQGQIDGIKTTADAADALSKENKDKIDVLNGDVNTKGSVAKAIADAAATQLVKDQAQDGRIDAVEAKATATDGNLAALATATTAWGSF